MREKLVELICDTHYGIENRSTIRDNFQRKFIEKIADHLIANGVTINDATEQAYKNGYSAGYAAGRRSAGEGK